MGVDLTRRQLLMAFGALALLAAASFPDEGRADVSLQTKGLGFGPPHPFSFDHLRERARKLAGRPFQPSPVKHPRLMDRITYDVSQKIRYHSKDALWKDGRHSFPIEFFHLDRYARRPVEIYAVTGGQAHRVLYSPNLFSWNETGLGIENLVDLGFSGFRVMNTGREPGDWLAFQGASYFRSAGPLNQYGMSARGIAIDTTVPGVKEQFPRFTALWIEEPSNPPDTVVVYALLDGASLTGAYRIICHKRETITMDIHADIFPRTDIAQLGLAPLTSMYWYSETNQRTCADWHPEIHDSDGLGLWTGDGERIWVPLNNPRHPQTNTYLDHNPRGFGLLQRDRNFDHYLDDSAYYNRRPTVWVEPRGDWGGGRVVLLALPTTDETEDNIVAFWQSDRKATAGTHHGIDYRLHWTAQEPFPPKEAVVVATRLGQPGIPGQHRPRDPYGRKFVIEFTGGPLTKMQQRYDIEAVVTASRGEVHNRHVLKILGTDRWRSQFDLHVKQTEPVDLRCFMRLGEKTLSETWLFQYLPGDYGFDCTAASQDATRYRAEQSSAHLTGCKSLPGGSR
jgi:periplasmic glucans biosynthesis protein